MVLRLHLLISFVSIYSGKWLLSEALLNVQPTHAIHVWSRKYIIFSLTFRILVQRYQKLALILISEAVERRQME